MTQAETSSYSVNIFFAGPIDVAKQIIRKRAKEIGMCITINPTTYIYSGGEEEGYVVGFINYPKYPKSFDDIWAEAVVLATLLKEGTYQDSYTLASPRRTVWISDRGDV